MSDDTVRQALLDHWREECPPEETMLVSRFVISAEVIDSEGDESLRIMTTENTPPWISSGLLRGANRIIDGMLDDGWESD